jgi:hypothetical protein
VRSESVEPTDAWEFSPARISEALSRPADAVSFKKSRRVFMKEMCRNLVCEARELMLSKFRSGIFQLFGTLICANGSGPGEFT